jgi:hypothetical protein
VVGVAGPELVADGGDIGAEVDVLGVNVGLGHPGQVGEAVEHRVHVRGGGLDAPGVAAACIAERVAVLLGQDFREPAHGPERGAQVVGDGVGEGGQVLVGHLEVCGALLHLPFQG